MKVSMYVIYEMCVICEYIKYACKYCILEIIDLKVQYSMCVLI